MQLIPLMRLQENSGLTSPWSSLFIGHGISLSLFPCVKGNLPTKAEYVWWTGLTHARDGWKCWSTERGALSVMTAGASRMQEWFVVSWDTIRESYFVPAILLHSTLLLFAFCCLFTLLVCFRIKTITVNFLLDTGSVLQGPTLSLNLMWVCDYQR